MQGILVKPVLWGMALVLAAGLVGDALLSAQVADEPEQLVLAGQGLQKARIALDATGRSHIVSDQGRGGKKLFHSYFDGQSWQTVELHPRGLDSGEAYEPQIVITPDGTAFVGFHWVDRKSGRPLQTAGLIRIYGVAYKPSIGELMEVGRGYRTNVRLGPAGEVYAMWRKDPDLFYRIYTEHGVGSAPYRLTHVRLTFPDEEMGMCGGSFDFDVGPDGVVHGVCTNIFGVHYSNSEMVAADRGVLKLTSNCEVGCESAQTRPILAVDRSQPDVIYILFTGVNNKAYLLRHQQSLWWPPLRAIPAESQQGESRAPAFLAAAPGGGAVLSWMDNRSGGFEVYVKYLSQAGEFAPEQRIAKGKNPRFAFEGRKRLHVVYMRGGDLYYKVVSFPPTR